jgi:transcriptional regulator GlxA family with amidase domain
MQTSADGGIVLVTFREGGASAFFREPLHEIYGTTTDLHDLVPRRDIDRVRTRLASAAGKTQRVAVVEQFLMGRLRPVSRDPVVAAAFRTIQTLDGRLRIGELATTLAISRDRLEKRFRSAVGASPKRLASIVRLRRAIDLYRPDTNLAQLSVDAGYFDQSHFIREFRAFTGTPPRRFFGSDEHC